MFIYDRIILKNDSSYQALELQEKKDLLFIFGHCYFAYWLARKLPFVPYILLLAVFLLSLICSSEVLLLIALIFSVLPLPLFILFSFSSKIEEFLTDRFRNINLNNSKVISKKDWEFIKKNYHDDYVILRSESCNHECYDSTLAITNMLKDSELTILWLSVKFLDRRVWHAVIKRGDYIYDSNLRKTYLAKEYLKAYHAIVYKELSYDEYSLNSGTKHISKLFAEFQEWFAKNNCSCSIES